MNWIILKLVRFYQYFISPWFGQNCLYHPTCSNYTIDAFRGYNFLLASLLVIGRIIRCTPLSHGGYDPVPKKFCGIKIKK